MPFQLNAKYTLHTEYNAQSDQTNYCTTDKKMQPMLRAYLKDFINIRLDDSIHFIVYSISNLIWINDGFLVIMLKNFANYMQRTIRNSPFLFHTHWHFSSENIFHVTLDNFVIDGAITIIESIGISKTVQSVRDYLFDLIKLTFILRGLRIRQKSNAMEF